MTPDVIGFWTLAVLLVGSGLSVVLSKNLFHSVLWLAASLIGTAGIFLLLDAEFLAGHRFPYQEDMSLVEDIDLLASTPGEDINWLEDITLLEDMVVAAANSALSQAKEIQNSEMSSVAGGLQLPGFM